MPSWLSLVFCFCVGMLSKFESFCPFILDVSLHSVRTAALLYILSSCMHAFYLCFSCL